VRHSAILVNCLAACTLLAAAMPSANVYGDTVPAEVPDASPPRVPGRMHVYVPTRHVDLATRSGVASFYRRLERAARRACDYGNIPGYYDKACAADALERAVWGRGVVALIELHQRATGGGRPRRESDVVRLVCGSDRPLEFCGTAPVAETARRTAGR
jgi:UrcA family protein